MYINNGGSNAQNETWSTLKVVTAGKPGIVGFTGTADTINCLHLWGCFAVWGEEPRDNGLC